MLIMSRTSDALRLIRLKFYGTLVRRVEANTSKFPNQALINSRKWFFVRNQKTHTNVQNEKFFFLLCFGLLLFAFSLRSLKLYTALGLTDSLRSLNFPDLNDIKPGSEMTSSNRREKWWDVWGLRVVFFDVWIMI